MKVRLYPSRKQALIRTAAGLSDPLAVARALAAVCREYTEGRDLTPGVFVRTDEKVGIAWALVHPDQHEAPIVRPAGAFEIGRPDQRSRLVGAARGLLAPQPPSRLIVPRPHVVLLRGVSPLDPIALKLRMELRPEVGLDRLSHFRLGRRAVLALELRRLQLAVVLAHAEELDELEVGTSARATAAALAAPIRAVVETLDDLDPDYRIE